MAFFLRKRIKEFSSKREAAQASRMQDTKAHAYIEQRLGVPIHRFTDHTSYLRAGCSKVWATFRACHLVASVVQSLHYRLEKKDNDKWEPLPDSPEAKFLHTPNPFDSWSEMLYLWTYHMKLTGSAFWMKDEINGRGQPTNLYPLLPQCMRIIPDPKKNIAGYIYQVNGRELPLTPEEVIHFRRPHPMSFVLGLGDIEPSEHLYNDFINRAVFQEKFIERGAQPSGILSLKSGEVQPTEDEWAKMKAWWNREYVGRENAGRVAFLSGEWSYQQLGLSQQQMQSLEKDEHTLEQIFQNHGVPLSVAGFRKAANYACLPAGELVTTPMGLTPIEGLVAGEMILQFDECRGTREVPVEAIIEQGEAEVLEIKTIGRILRASDNHPILCAEQGKLVFREAQFIVKGDMVVVHALDPYEHGVFRLHLPHLPRDYGLQIVESVRSIGKKIVYDLATTGTHTFIASGVVTHNTAKLEDINFRRYEVFPLVALLLAKLNSETGLFKLFNPDIVLDFDKNGLIDIEQVMKEFIPLVKHGGMTPNELREKAGLARVDNVYLDQYFVDNTLVPLEMAGLAAVPPQDAALQKIMQAIGGNQGRNGEYALPVRSRD